MIAIDLSRLLKLRLLVARFGEGAFASWSNAKGQTCKYGGRGSGNAPSPGRVKRIAARGRTKAKPDA